jgi:hypothetical protein
MIRDAKAIIRWVSRLDPDPNAHDVGHVAHLRGLHVADIEARKAAQAHSLSRRFPHFQTNAAVMETFAIIHYMFDHTTSSWNGVRSQSHAEVVLPS